jgi:hypothetical protein
LPIEDPSLNFVKRKGQPLRSHRWKKKKEKEKEKNPRCTIEAGSDGTSLLARPVSNF